MRFKSLKNKMVFFLSIVTTIVLLSIIAYISVKNSGIAISNSKKHLFVLAERLSLKIEAELEIGMDATNAMASSMESFKVCGNSTINRDIVNHLIKQVLSKNKMCIASGSLWEPNAFDGKDSIYINTAGHDKTGRFIPYWSKDSVGNMSIEPLVDYTEEGTGDYYLIPKKTKKEAIIDPYIYPVQGKDVLMITLVTPILLNDKFLGISTVDVDIAFIQNYIEQEKQHIYEGKVSIEIISYNGTYAANTERIDYVGKNISSYQNEFQTELSEIQQGNKIIHEDDDEITVGVPINVGETDTPWQVRVSIPNSVILRDVRANLITVVLLSVIGLIIMFLSVTIITKNIISPLTKSVDFAKQISKGNLTTKLTAISNDELGMLSENLNAMVTQLRKVINSVNCSSEIINRASKQMSFTSQNISQGANEQAASTEEISSTMEQITSNIQQNTDNAKTTEKISKEAQKGALDAGIKAKQSTEAQNIISEKIEIINDIAFQTNILALNAAVEAARAGEHGKGFAVVAAEVRKLAEQSKIAAEEITNLTHNTKELADKAGESLSGVIPQIEKTANLVQEIAFTSIEQNTGAEQVNNSIQQLNQVAQQNAASSEELASTAEEMTAQAQQLKEAVSYFKLD